MKPNRNAFGVFFQIEISTKEDNEESYKLKQLLIKHATPLIRDNLAKYIKQLREGKMSFHATLLSCNLKYCIASQLTLIKV